MIACSDDSRLRPRWMQAISRNPAGYSTVAVSSSADRHGGADGPVRGGGELGRRDLAAGGGIERLAEQRLPRRLQLRPGLGVITASMPGRILLPGGAARSRRRFSLSGPAAGEPAETDLRVEPDAEQQGAGLSRPRVLEHCGLGPGRDETRYSALPRWRRPAVSSERHDTHVLWQP
jgi:hypothetical protein